MPSSFKSLGLSSKALDAVRRARFNRPTPVQTRVIPLVLEGKDVIGCAATGTGKTAAFVLPLIERFAGQTGTLGLIVAPTRELVLQIAEEIRFFGEGRGITAAVVIGGTDAGKQIEALALHPTFVLGTPGRLVELTESGTAVFGKLRALVVDEADRMLDMGFAPQLASLLRFLPQRRQSLLFSATLGQAVAAFAKSSLNNPTHVEVTPSGTPAERAKQMLYLVKPEHKYALLLTLLSQDSLSTLIFSSTRDRTDKVQATLKREGFKTAVIHSERTQNQRKQALEGFRDGQYRCLVATDVAARGLDIEEIGQVINFDLPHSPEDYVHRIGRTARAGASGRAFSFATREDSRFVSNIEKVIRRDIPRGQVPHENPVFMAEMARFGEIEKEFEARNAERKNSRKQVRPERAGARGTRGARGVKGPRGAR